MAREPKMPKRPRTYPIVFQAGFEHYVLGKEIMPMYKEIFDDFLKDNHLTKDDVKPTKYTRMLKLYDKWLATLPTEIDVEVFDELWSKAEQDIKR